LVEHSLFEGTSPVGEFQFDSYRGIFIRAKSIQVNSIFVERQLVFLQTEALLLRELGNRLQKLRLFTELYPDTP
jgi:hypothetical protein